MISVADPDPVASGTFWWIRNPEFSPADLDPDPDPTLILESYRYSVLAYKNPFLTIFLKTVYY
jgi:hypothetical protein